MEIEYRQNIPISYPKEGKMILKTEKSLFAIFKLIYEKVNIYPKNMNRI